MSPKFTRAFSRLVDALPSLGWGRGASVAASAVAVAIGLLFATAPQASALSKNTYSTSFSGSGTNALSEPTDIAVDQSTGDVYVADPAQHRVEKFTPAGVFILMFGKAVDKTTGADLCTAASGDECQPGAPGSSPGAFESPHRLFLAVDNTPGGEGDVYVGDRGPSLISKFDSSGHLLSAWGSGGQLDGSTSGDLPFVGTREVGEPPGEPSDTRGVMGVAVSPGGDLLVIAANAKHQFYRFAQDGSFVETFRIYSYTNGINPVGFGVDRADDAYVGRNGLEKFSLAPTGAERLAGPSGDEDAAGKVAAPQGIAIDQATRDLYYVSGGDESVEHFAPSCEPETRTFSSADDIHCTPLDTFGATDLSQPQGLAVDEASETVYVADTGNHRVAVFTAVPYLPSATASAEAQTPTEELLRGEVDPAGGGEVTACHFEYAPRSAFLSEVQVITISPTATGGTFTLTFEGETTEPINVEQILNPSYNRIAEALFKLPSIGEYHVEVRDSFDHRRHPVEFVGPLYQVNVPQLTGDFSGLEPSGATATIATETDVRRWLGFRPGHRLRSRPSLSRIREHRRQRRSARSHLRHPLPPPPGRRRRHRLLHQPHGALHHPARSAPGQRRVGQRNLRRKRHGPRSGQPRRRRDHLSRRIRHSAAIRSTRMGRSERQPRTGRRLGEDPAERYRDAQPPHPRGHISLPRSRQERQRGEHRRGPDDLHHLPLHPDDQRSLPQRPRPPADRRRAAPRLPRLRARLRRRHRRL